MFDKSVIDTDEFLEMPLTSQALYFHLNMRADDDGFVSNWKTIMKITGTKEDDMKILASKQYIIPFESGVIVIRHWKINNFLRKDRHNDTNYVQELEFLKTEKNGEYSLKTNEELEWSTNGQPTVNPDKNSIEENSIDKNSLDNIHLTKLEEDTRNTSSEIELPFGEEFYESKSIR